MASSRPSRRTARDSLYSALSTAILFRRDRPEVVHTLDGPRPAWVVDERQTLLDTTNQIRAQCDLPPVDLAAIVQIDQSAAGHIDWLGKVVMRCAALAVGEDWRG